MSTLTFANATGSISFADSPAPGVPVSGWFFRELVGWYDVTDSKSDINERPQAHGAFGVSQDWRTSAAFSAVLFYIGTDHADAVAAQNQFNRLTGGGKPLTVTFDDGGVSTSRVSSVRNARPVDSRGSKNVTLETALVAPDPLRYGTTVLVVADTPVAGGGLIFPLGSGASYIDFLPGGSTGRISVTNNGTAPVYLTFDVSGGVDGFVVTDVTSNRAVRFDRQIPVGSVVTVNQRTGRASIDGPTNDVSGFLTSRQFWVIPPGETHDIQFQPLGAVVGAPRLTVRQTPASY